jgi:hypothetical protein
MRALVVYESMYGNTHAVAEAIAEGLRGAFDVAVFPVDTATSDKLAAADLLVVGGPTHAHGMSSKQSRKGAVGALDKTPDLALDPDAMGEGLRDWFHELTPMSGRAAAAFDTRFEMNPVLTGRASKGIARRLKHHGYRLVVEPESFFVEKDSTLVAHELERATEWARDLAASVIEHATR